MPSNKAKRNEEFRSVRPVEAYLREVPYSLSESAEKYLLKVFFYTWHIRSDGYQILSHGRSAENYR
jgi:hypothetical protein